MTNTNTAHGRKGREWLRIQDDAQYGLGYVDSRFEVPFELPPTYDIVRAAAAETVAKTIDHFERLSNWKYVERIPIQYFVSELPTRDQLDMFNTLKEGDIHQGRKHTAVGIRSGANVVMKARIWFVRPLAQVNLDEQEETIKGESEGFVNLEDMPEGSLI